MTIWQRSTRRRSRRLLDAASAKMTTEELTRLGVLVAVDQQDIEDVAKQWLTDQGLVS